jgi:hypothetical protein
MQRKIYGLVTILALSAAVGQTVAQSPQEVAVGGNAAYYQQTRGQGAQSGAANAFNASYGYNGTGPGGDQYFNASGQGAAPQVYGPRMGAVPAMAPARLGTSQYVVSSQQTGGRDMRVLRSQINNRIGALNRRVLSAVETAQQAEYQRGFLNPKYQMQEMSAALQGQETNKPQTQADYTREFLYAPQNRYELGAGYNYNPGGGGAFLSGKADELSPQEPRTELERQLEEYRRMRDEEKKAKQAAEEEEARRMR